MHFRIAAVTAIVSLAIVSTPAGAAAADEPSTSTSGEDTGDPQPEVQPAAHPDRGQSVEPKPAEPAPPGRTTFEIDPIVDGAIIAVSFGFAGLADLINSTGEIRPQQIAPTFQRGDLLSIDRIALSQSIDSNAATYSNVGVVTAIAFAALDPILSGLREDSVQAGIADGFIYAESIGVTYALTNMAKMAVRRPRPKAYLDAEEHRGDPNYSNSDTDSSLSFFSGHSAIVATVGATATYLAFARSPKGPRPWITLALAAGLSTFVSIERVRAGAHFPTDVIAATIAGAGVGVLVPHLHRTTDAKQRRVWIGVGPSERGEGGSFQLGGVF